ncbi:Similar to non-heme chloroperoxidase, sll5080 homolog [Janthinobacterium sp. CG23_2]|nr:Similar to non-heme chloroperoxidase, sll5080 homolog [Janthinobacterium sp. CG23_2]CUU29173.1 Similar to non-heme chloroperoxidase, sll5080 homolog [Janthinobacterium sp. CG23_2]
MRARAPRSILLQVPGTPHRRGGDRNLHFSTIPRRFTDEHIYDQIVPIEAAGKAAARLVKHATLLVYPGAPHGLTDTHKDKVNADLLAFIKS